MASIFQKVIGGDVDSLGTQIQNPGQKIIYRCEQFGTTPAGSWLKLEYFLAIVNGLENSDIAASGEIGFELGGKSTRVAVPFTSGIHDGKARAHGGQALQLLVPAGAKIIVNLPVYFNASGPNGGAEVALLGSFINA